MQNELAKRDAILNLRKELIKSSVDDYVILSFSSHGILDKELDFYFCTNKGVDVSYEKDRWRNGLFTYSVLSALSKNREADINPKDRQVTVSELIAYVTKTTKNLSKGLQVPTVREEDICFRYRIW